MGRAARRPPLGAGALSMGAAAPAPRIISHQRAVRSLSLDLAREIRTGRATSASITASLGVLVGVAAPLEGARTAIETTLTLWDTEKACDLDVENDLRLVAATLKNQI